MRRRGPLSSPQAEEHRSAAPSQRVRSLVPSFERRARRLAPAAPFRRARSWGWGRGSRPDHDVKQCIDCAYS